MLYLARFMFLPKHPLRAAMRGIRFLVDPGTPLLAHLVVTRRCNLTCGYCNEYDDYSPPVPTEELLRRVDKLAELGTVSVTMTGGEPCLHPELDKVVERVVSHGMVCTSISNGYPITKKWIERFNKAGLTLIQISIDNIEPNEVSQKSWSKLKKKLELLKEHAKFGVNVNAVLGSCSPEETRKVVADVKALGFFMTVNLLHDGAGQIIEGLAGSQLRTLFDELRGKSNKSLFHFIGEGWEDRMLEKGTAPWKCRAGARYFYVDEHGKVAYCSQRRMEPGIPLARYGREDLLREFNTEKGCEAGCTISCVRRASALDEWRAQPLKLRERDDQPVRLPVVTLS